MAKKKKSTMGTKVVTGLFIVISVSLSFRLIALYDSYNKLREENYKIELLLEAEKVREAQLSDHYSKINDPAYLTAYAREQLLYSENGSIVIRISDDEDDE